MKLPGFHQAFGSTEIGRFSQHEGFFETTLSEDPSKPVHESSESSHKTSQGLPAGTPTRGKRGRSANNSTVKRKIFLEKQQELCDKRTNNHLTKVDNFTPDNVLSSVLPNSIPVKSEAGNENNWDLNNCETDNYKFFFPPNHRTVYDQTTYSNSNDTVTGDSHNSNEYYNKTKYPSVHSSHQASIYNRHSLRLPERLCEDTASPSEDLSLPMTSHREAFRYKNSSSVPQKYSQLHFSDSFNYHSQEAQYWPVSSHQYWNPRFGSFGTSSSTRSASYQQTHSGVIPMMHATPSYEMPILPNDEYRNYYNHYSKHFSDYDEFQSSYNNCNSSHYHQQCVHPYQRKNCQFQSSMQTSFNNE